MPLPPEKRAFLLKIMGPRRTKEIENCLGDRACAREQAEKEREFQDIVTGVKAKAKDSKPTDPILQDIALLTGVRPPLSPKAEAEIQQLEQCGDPTCLALADLMRHGAVQG